MHNQDSQAMPERRASPRLPVTFEVVVYHESLMLSDCSISNLSPEGAFVVTSGCRLPDRAMVDLAFAVSASVGSSARFHARVTHSDDRGIGVQLLHDSPESWRALAEVLYSA
jgi:hypothetical protein